MRFKVRVQSGASRTEVVGFQDDVLRLRVTAPPERGKANDAVIALLAEVLGVAKGKVLILRGHSSQDKLVEVTGASVEEVLQGMKQV